MACHTCTASQSSLLQHAEFTDSFKKYLESKGLEEVIIYHEAFWPIVGVLCEPLWLGCPVMVSNSPPPSLQFS